MERGREGEGEGVERGRKREGERKRRYRSDAIGLAGGSHSDNTSIRNLKKIALKQ